MRKRRPATPYHVALAEIIAALVTHPPVSIAALSEVSGLNELTVGALMRACHQRGAVHIAGWDPDRHGRHKTRLWRVGPGVDAPRPKLSRAERAARNNAFVVRAAGVAITRALAGGVPNSVTKPARS